MAISAAFGLDARRNAVQASTRRSTHSANSVSSAAARAGERPEPVNDFDNSTVQQSDSDHLSMTNVSLGDQLQHNLPSPTYAKGAAFMSFDNPLVSRILQGDVALKQHASAERTSPYSSKRAPARSPTPGGIRRIMRRAHTPEGLVMHYESRLCAFLGIDNNGNADGLLSDDEDWQVIDTDEGLFSPFGRDMVFDEGDMVILSEALMHAQQSASRRSSSITAGIKSCLVAEWPIQDSFTRLIVHTMCRYYGLVSYSDTLDNGRCVLHICHPRFFSEGVEVNAPKVAFYQYLYNDSK